MTEVGGPITVLVVDDHPVVRDGLKGMLAGRPDFEVVGEAADGQEAVSLAAVLEPTVVLMDLRMPTMDGVTALRRILDRSPGHGRWC
jgi:DNA-binding NarL/FixJ family response regulator